MPTYEIFIDSKPKKIELTKSGETSFEVKIDNKKLHVEAQTSKPNVEKKFSIKIAGKAYKVEVPEFDHEKPFLIKVEEASFKAEIKKPAIKRTLTLTESTPLVFSKKTFVQTQVAEGVVTAPMTGKTISVKVKKGDQVQTGQVLCIIEAMKMENEINAPKAGIIQELNVSDGASVSEGEVLFVIG